MFSSPCNPTGSMYSKEELKSIADVILPHPQIFILSDEIYEHIRFEGTHESIAQFDFIKERVIIVNGVSKGYAMTGWRIGYIGASKEIAKACDKMQGQFTSAASSIAQKAAVKALNTDWSQYAYMRDLFLKRRNLVLDLMAQIPGWKFNKPKGAFYVFPDVTYFFGKSEGTTTITYQDINSCTATTTFTVIATPTVTVPSSFTICLRTSEYSNDKCWKCL